MPKTVFTAAGTLCLLVLSGPASATTLVPVTLEQIAQTAEVIVVGEVVSSAGRMDPSRGMIFTHTTLRVDQVLRGEGAPSLRSDGTVEIVAPGGVDGESWTRVHGAPDPGPEGQRVVAFLYGERDDRYSNVVFWQGLFHLDGGTVRQTGEPAAAFLARVGTFLLEKPAMEGGPGLARPAREARP